MTVVHGTLDDVFASVIDRSKFPIFTLLFVICYAVYLYNLLELGTNNIFSPMNSLLFVN